MNIAEIDRTKKEYTNHLSRLIGSLHNQRLVPFLCAGVSNNKPSCLPLSWHLKKPLIDNLIESMKVILHRRNSKLDIPLIRKRLEDKPLEYILEALREIYGNAVFQYLSMYLDTNPNYNVNHIAIALLAKYYKLKYVITLNFDVLFEHALQRFKVSYNVVHP